jgi:hypothetical protein
MLRGAEVSAMTEPPSGTVARCAAWLALDGEIDRLSRRWADLETQMAHEFDWFALSFEERRSIPQAQEMFELEERLDQLSDEREIGLNALAELKAEDLRSVASKLAVAALVLRQEGGAAHRIIADAVNDLAAPEGLSYGAAPATRSNRP